MIFEEIIFQDSGLSHSPIFCSESPQLTIGIFTIQILYHLLNYLHMFMIIVKIGIEFKLSLPC